VKGKGSSRLPTDRPISLGSKATTRKCRAGEQGGISPVARWLVPDKSELTSGVHPIFAQGLPTIESRQHVCIVDMQEGAVMHRKASSRPRRLPFPRAPLAPLLRPDPHTGWVSRSEEGNEGLERDESTRDSLHLVGTDRPRPLTARAPLLYLN
jgi:hypothetical protein